MSRGRFWGLLGWAEVWVKGRFPEKYINLASSAGMRLWDMKKTSDELRFKTDLSNLAKLEAISSSAGFEMEIQKKSGMLVVGKFLMKRKLLLAGFFCFWICLYLLSGLVWRIDLEGLENIDGAEIASFIDQHGLRKWARFQNLDLHELEELMALEYPQIAWIAIEKSGTRVTIRIVEKDYDPMQYGEVIDIVAEFDGIISEIVVLQGLPMVEPGMTVAKGDVLIAGYRDSDRLVNAAGSIKAIVFFEGYGEAAQEEIEKEYTGNEQLLKILELGKIQIPLSRQTPEYENYEIEESVRPLRGSNLPVCLRINRLMEIKLTTISYSAQEAEDLAKNRALLRAHQQTHEHADILKIEVKDMSQDTSIYRFQVMLTVETRIGRDQVNSKGD